MIFILGGKGFVGSAFARACEKKGREYLVIDRNTYGRQVGKSCDIFINAAGNSKKFLSKQNPLRDFDESVRSVRRSLVDFRFGRYVLVSSCDVYPDCSSPLVTVEDLPIDVSRQSAYGFHKYLAEQCVIHDAGEWLISRFGGFVGPGLKKNPIFDILKGGRLWLDPRSELQYMHTDRAAEVVLDLIDKGRSRRIFNICGRGVVSLQEVMDWAGRHVPVEPESPVVRYEVAIEKISALADIPESRQTVMDFIRAEQGAHSGETAR